MGADELPRTLSHDLRGPLMAISGAAELICEMAPEADEPGGEIRDWCDQIQYAAGVMERFIHDVLEFGSLEDAQLRLRLVRDDLTVLVRSVAEMFQNAASSKHIRFDTDFPAGATIATYDRDRMLQVVSNIVHNAITFTPHGGSIRVGVARSGADVLVTVTDTGSGIPKAELDTIFERFRRLSEADRRGLGVGLYIAKWIVEAHGGRIWAESQVGRGSTFCFTLPA
jgi:signal transduction histidine kinase